MKKSKSENKRIKALVLTPTRELAFQIKKHFLTVLGQDTTNIRLMTLVGGMSKEKQERLLSYCPDILIATPGRLWEFIDSGLYDYLETLKTIDFLVIDEADKMIELGHFEEMDKILGFLYSKPENFKENDDENLGTKGKQPKLHSDSGISDDFLNEIAFDTPTELPSQYFYDTVSRTIKLRLENEKTMITKNKKTSKDEKKIDSNFNSRNIVRNKKLKTFLVSATLTKTFKKGAQKVQLDKAKTPKKPNENLKLESLVQKIKFSSPKPKIIDLSQVAFMPEKLKKFKTLTSEEDKPIYIYNFLIENPGYKTLIFVNTISVARRLTLILHKALNLKQMPLCLHSHQQQKQRLKKLDDFLSGKNPLIVCTDIAARGLDIPKVQHVIHYQIPKDIDTYVHRSGRTARIGCEGVVLALVGPKEMPRFAKISEELGEDHENWGKPIKEKIRQMFERIVNEVTEEKQKNEGKRMREWFEKKSKEGDIILDEGMKYMYEKKEKAASEGKKQNKNKNKKQNKMFRKEQEKRVRRNGVFLNPETINELLAKMGK